MRLVKLILKVAGALLCLGLAALFALPVFGYIAGFGPFFVGVFWVVVVVVLAWLFFRGRPGPVSELSLMGRQASKDGLL